MSFINDLIESNQAWAERIRSDEPGFFESLAKGQAPSCLWIGCSDSRVPVNEIVGTRPGELFVHRNIANLVVHTDVNCQSVIQYAVNALKVRYAVVCGHYGCGGVHASMSSSTEGVIDTWLHHIRDLSMRHEAELEAIADPTGRADRLCELNVVEQSINIARTSAVQAAWGRGQELTVVGLIYRLDEGLLHDLGVRISSEAELEALCHGGV